MNVFPCPHCKRDGARAVELLEGAKAALAAVDYRPNAVERSMARTLGAVASKVNTALEALTPRGVS